MPQVKNRGRKASEPTAWGRPQPLCGCNMSAATRRRLVDGGEIAGHAVFLHAVEIDDVLAGGVHHPVGELNRQGIGIRALNHHAKPIHQALALILQQGEGGVLVLVMLIDIPLYYGIPVVLRRRF